MKNYKLTQISSESNTLKNKINYGTVPYGVKIGEYFLFIKDNGGYIMTTEVKEIEENHQIIKFKTRNSIYQLEEYDEQKN